LITPCGIRERGVTSLERELGRRVDFDEVKAVLLGALAAQFGVILERADASLQLAAS
jgi:lipoyl(octanoyl) transferase